MNNILFYLYTNSFKYIKTSMSRSYYDAGYLLMPMQFFDVVLTLMDEQKLRWQIL